METGRATSLGTGATLQHRQLHPPNPRTLGGLGVKGGAIVRVKRRVQLQPPHQVGVGEEQATKGHQVAVAYCSGGGGGGGRVWMEHGSRRGAH